MTDGFDEATRLKNLLGRREAIVNREKDTRTVNHGIVERMEIDQDIRSAAPWLLEVAGSFQRGDADLLDELIEYIDFLMPSGMEAVEVGDEEFEVLLDDQKLLIRAKDHLFRMLAAAKIMEGK